MSLWLSYGSQTFQAPLSAFARTHPNEIIGNEICLDKSPGLHSACHDSGILTSCWGRYTSRTLAKKKNGFPELRREQIFPTSAPRFPSSGCVVTAPAARRLETAPPVKLSIRTCVFLIGLFPNLINCECGWRDARPPESQSTDWCHAFRKYSAVVILFGAPCCSDSGDLYNVSVCEKEWKQSEGREKKTIKRCHCCVYLGNITLRNGHTLTDSGQSAETLCWSNTHIWSLILQEERGKRVQPYPVMPAVTNQRTIIPSCSQRSEQKRTIVSFPAGQIVPCVPGLLCWYSVTYSKPSVSDASVSDDDVKTVRVERGLACGGAVESVAPWQRAASSQPVSSSAERSSLSTCGRTSQMYFANAPFLTLFPY